MASAVLVVGTLSLAEFKHYHSAHTHRSPQLLMVSHNQQQSEGTTGKARKIHTEDTRVTV